jgi:hypothetical protein
MCVTMRVYMIISIIYLPKKVGVTLSPSTLRGAVQLRDRPGKQARPRDDNGT